MCTIRNFIYGFQQQHQKYLSNVSIWMQYLVEAYETRVADEEKKKLMVPLPLDDELKLKISSVKREWGASWWEQFSILFCRGIKERKHDYFSWLRITQVLSTAVILGLLWWQSDSHTTKGLEDQVNHCFSTFIFPQKALSLNFPPKETSLVMEGF